VFLAGGAPHKTRFQRLLPTFMAEKNPLKHVF